MIELYVIASSPMDVITHIQREWDEKGYIAFTKEMAYENLNAWSWSVGSKIYKVEIKELED